jgi:hypothetical protein
MEKAELGAMIIVGVPLWMAVVAWRFAPKGTRLK